MTEFLLKHIIKEGRVTDLRAAYGTIGSAAGIAVNVLLFLCKLAVGLVTGSISVMGDAFNNLSDAASSVISLAGVRMAGKPPDKEHPFGHGRVEYICAFVVAGLIIQVGLTLFQSSFEKILHPQAVAFSTGSILILLLGVGAKLWLGLFNRDLGRRIGSQLMQAAARDALGDVAVTSSVIVSILISHYSGLNLDGFIGLLVSAVVTWSGISIAKDTLTPLIGEATDPELAREITTFINSFEGIEGTHDLIVHNYGSTKKMASIHAEVARQSDLEYAHAIIDHAEKEAFRRFGILLVIHPDPVETKDLDVLELKSELRSLLKKEDGRLAFHDFRLERDAQGSVVSFDLVLPEDYEGKRTARLEALIRDSLYEKVPGCRCEITWDTALFVQDEKE